MSRYLTKKWAHLLALDSAAELIRAHLGIGDALPQSAELCKAEVGDVDMTWAASPSATPKTVIRVRFCSASTASATAVRAWQRCASGLVPEPRQPASTRCLLSVAGGRSARTTHATSSRVWATQQRLLEHVFRTDFVTLPRPSS